nr:MAG TPA: hypothetical protein [Crassvirales sp.]
MRSKGLKHFSYINIQPVYFKPLRMQINMYNRMNLCGIKRIELFTY